jgi:hypothetical protein
MNHRVVRRVRAGNLHKKGRLGKEASPWLSATFKGIALAGDGAELLLELLILLLA